MENFKDWLRGQIAKNDWKYEQLAEAIGSNESSISQWVNGKHVPKPPVLLRLAEITHEDPFRLLNLAYNWPMPDSDVADERVSGMIRLVKSMSDEEFERLEHYLQYLVLSSNGRLGKRGTGSPKLNTDDIIAAMRLLPEQERREIIKAFSRKS